MNKLDFTALNRTLLTISSRVCMDILPGGKPNGNEYKSSGLHGGNGTSLSVNLKTGVWSDFAVDGCGGADLISLYAAARGVSMGAAYRALAESYDRGLLEPAPTPGTEIEHPCRVAPADVADPSMQHRHHGTPSMTWCYRDANGGRFFFIARYDTPSGKQFVPWTYRQNRWTPKAWTHPRPIYRIDALTANPERHVLICEGEKSSDAAQRIVGDVYVCTTWAGGARAVATADWSILRGRHCLVWADADDPGRIAGDTLIQQLQSVGAASIKSINVWDGHADGWDAADAEIAGMDINSFAAWAKPRVQVIGELSTVPSREIPADTPRQSAGIAIDPVSVSGATAVTWDRLGLVVTQQGQTVCNTDNVRRIIDGTPELSGHIWGDEFYGDILTDYDGGAPRPWTDRDTLLLTSLIQRQFSCVKFTDTLVFGGICTVAAFDLRNSVRDWALGLTWDGVPRLDTWLHTYMGAHDTEFNRCAGRNWFVGMAARMLSPGCQMDNQIIFKSGQGGGVRDRKGKSSALRAIGGDWYTTAGNSILDGKFYEKIKGKILVEVGELVAFSRSDIEMIKDVMTTCSDRYRVPYGKKAADNPRTCVFAATTNEDNPLRDHTGNRRFWCVDVGAGAAGPIDVSAIERDREQLFAESVKKYLHYKNTRRDEDGWWLMPELETAEIEEQNRECDPWEEIIGEWLIGRSETTAVEVLESCLDVPAERITRAMQMRVGVCLKLAGWVKVRSRSFGQPRQVWKKERYESVPTVPTSEDFDF